jgi:alpha-1,6-mannosyltransferase
VATTRVPHAGAEQGVRQPLFTGARRERATRTGHTRDGISPALRVLGVLGLAAVVASAFLLAASAAGSPTSTLVPARSGGWPAWMAGPLRNLGLSIGSDSFQTFTLLMAGGYGAVLLAVRGRALPLWSLALAIVAAHVLLLLGPPLISQDVFGYLGFGRLGALHGLDPYTHVAAEVPADPVYLFLGWPRLTTPYGPLFTLLSYAIAPLGLAGGLWTLKTLTVLCSLGAVALVGVAARRMGHSTRMAVAFVGLNPVLLELAVGGAHNDTLTMLPLALALLLTAGAAPRYRGGAAALAVGVGVKASAGLVLPFLVLAPRGTATRLRVLGVALLTLAALAVVALIGFGTHAFGFLGALQEQQQLIATHSIPAESARLFGLSGTPTWWRDLFGAAFAAVLALTLWRAARGADWRDQAAWATLALLLCTAWLLPWYAIWLLPLAALSSSGRVRAVTLLFCVYALLIHLPLADPLLSPPRNHHAPERIKAAGLQDLEHVNEIYAGRGHH